MAYLGSFLWNNNIKKHELWIVLKIKKINEGCKFLSIYNIE